MPRCFRRGFTRLRIPLRRGFTAIEALLTIGVIAIVAGVSVPMYRNYQITSDLDLAVVLTIHGLNSAQLKSQSGEDDGTWGYQSEVGTIFFGDAYAIRDPAYDETIGLPPGIGVSGIKEVIYSRVDGVPNVTGDVILTAVSGDRRIVTIGADGTLSSSGILEAVQDGGGTAGDAGGATGGDSGGDVGGTSGAGGADTGGTEGGDTGGTSGTDGGNGGGSSSSSPSFEASSAGGATGGGGDDGGSGDSGGGGSDNDDGDGEDDDGTPGNDDDDGSGDDDDGAGNNDDDLFSDDDDGRGDDDDGVSHNEDKGDEPPECAKQLKIAKDGTIETVGSVDVTFKVLGSAMTYGVGGPEVQVVAHASFDGGKTWVPLFGGNDIDGGEEQQFPGVAAGERILVRIHARHGWLYSKTYTSNESYGHIAVLRRGQKPPDYAPFETQASLAGFLRNILDGAGRIAIGEHDVVLLGEFGSLGGKAADFQDAAILVSFSQPYGSCAGKHDPKFAIHFDRLENSGKGDARKVAFVGPGSIAYADGQWIPLKDGDVVLEDSGLTEVVPGLAVKRGNGFVTVLLHGSHPDDESKEVVDARIVFAGATVASVENVEGQDAMEDPFDLVVNDGPGGDEVTVHGGGNASLLFQTRVAAADDAIKIFWTGAGAGVVEAPIIPDAPVTPAVGEDLCGVAFTIEDGKITIAEKADITIKALGSHAVYGKNGPEIQVHMSVSTDGGSTWESLYGFRDVDGGEEETLADIPAGSTLVFKAEGRYGWLFKNVVQSHDGAGHINVLRNGDADPGTAIYKTPVRLKRFLRSKIVDRKASIGKREALVLMELQDVGLGADFQDGVVLLTVEKPASGGICGAKTEDDEGGTEDGGTTQEAEEGGGSGETEEDRPVTVCHFPPGEPRNHQTITIGESAVAAHLAHGDRRGACEGDEDGDSIVNSEDLCPGTELPENVPTSGKMDFHRAALTADSHIFRHGPRKKISEYTLSDTHGCSCNQLVDVAENAKEYRFAQYPRLMREMRSLFPFYTNGARQFGCGDSILKMVKGYAF